MIPRRIIWTSNSQPQVALSMQYQQVVMHAMQIFHFMNHPPHAPCDFRRVIWTSNSHPQVALSMQYQQVVMHAISRDTSSFPRPCIYLQVGAVPLYSKHMFMVCGELCVVYHCYYLSLLLLLKLACHHLSLLLLQLDIGSCLRSMRRHAGGL